MWLYNGEEFTLEGEQLKDYLGFVYMITENDTDKKYIGKKFFWSKKILPITKKRKKRKRTLVESDWQKYYSSSETLKEQSAANPENYTREILMLCKTKGECSYFEAKLQFDNDVLLRDDFYNGIINCRINKVSVAHLKTRSM